MLRYKDSATSWFQLYSRRVTSNLSNSTETRLTCYNACVEKPLVTRSALGCRILQLYFNPDAQEVLIYLHHSKVASVLMAPVCALLRSARGAIFGKTHSPTDFKGRRSIAAAYRIIMDESVDHHGGPPRLVYTT